MKLDFFRTELLQCVEKPSSVSKSKRFSKIQDRFKSNVVDDATRFEPTSSLRYPIEL